MVFEWRSGCKGIYRAACIKAADIAVFIRQKLQIKGLPAGSVIESDGIGGAQVPLSFKDLVSGKFNALSVVLEDIVMVGIADADKFTGCQLLFEQIIVPSLILGAGEKIKGGHLIQKNKVIADAVVGAAKMLIGNHVGGLRHLGGTARSGIAVKADFSLCGRGVGNREAGRAPGTGSIPELAILPFVSAPDHGCRIHCRIGNGFLPPGSCFIRLRDVGTGGIQQIHDENRQNEIIPILQSCTLPFRSNLLYITVFT